MKIRNRVRRSDWDRLTDLHRPDAQRASSTPAPAPAPRWARWLAVAAGVAALTLAGATLCWRS